MFDLCTLDSPTSGIFFKLTYRHTFSDVHLLEILAHFLVVRTEAIFVVCSYFWK